MVFPDLMSPIYLIKHEAESAVSAFADDVSATPYFKRLNSGRYIQGRKTANGGSQFYWFCCNRMSLNYGLRSLMSL